MKLAAILSICAGMGVVATALVTHQCTLAAEEVLKEHRESLPEKPIERAKEEFKLVWKNYIPAFAVAGLTILCVIGSAHLSKKAILAAGAGASYVAANKDKIELKAREFSEEMQRRLRAQEPNELQTVELTGNGDLLCYESFTGRWFRSSREAVENGIKGFMDDFDYMQYANFNTLYNRLGITWTHFGNMMGWVNDPDYYDGGIDISMEYVESGEVNFGDPWVGEVCLDVNEPVLLISINTFPMECYDEI